MRRAFTLGLVTGIVYFTGTLYWITRVMAMYGDMAFWIAVLINAALVIYQAPTSRSSRWSRAASSRRTVRRR